MSMKLLHVVVIVSTMLLCSMAMAQGPFEVVVGEVSQDQYTSYHFDIESMGLGLYGGPDYNQGYRNRDGWWGGGTLGNQEARLYLTDQFTAMGLEVSTQGGYNNIVAELPGVLTPEKIYIVCGHFDHPRDEDGDHPGGDDNASGTAGVLEAARVLSRNRFDSTVRFIGFNSEEDGRLGSENYVNTVVVPNDENIMGVINLDMILRPGWDEEPDEPIDLDLVTPNKPGFFEWANAFMDAAAIYVPELPFDERNPNSSHYNGMSDHGRFVDAGYPAMYVSENTIPEEWDRSNAYYHTSMDASDSVANDPSSPSGVTYDYGFATNVVKATVATIAVEAVLHFPFDFNDDRVVDAQDVALMVDHWHTDNPLYDVAPLPLGDSIVDVQDLILLSENLFEDYRIIAHWKLDETEGTTAYDSVGTNNAYVIGGLWQPDSGQLGGALQFDGVDDFLIASPPLNPTDGPFSVFVWVKGGAEGQAIISEPGTDWLSLEPVSGYLMTELTYTSSSADNLRSETVITDGDWHRIGFVWDGSNRTLYVDGVAVAEDTQDRSERPTSGFYIGTGKLAWPGTYFSGLIDDVRIYNSAVSP